MSAVASPQQPVFDMFLIFILIFLIWYLISYLTLLYRYGREMEHNSSTIQYHVPWFHNELYGLSESLLSRLRDQRLNAQGGSGALWLVKLSAQQIHVLYIYIHIYSNRLEPLVCRIIRHLLQSFQSETEWMFEHEPWVQQGCVELKGVKAVDSCFLPQCCWDKMHPQSGRAVPALRETFLAVCQRGCVSSGPLCECVSVWWLYSQLFYQKLGNFGGFLPLFLFLNLVLG